MGEIGSGQFGSGDPEFGSPFIDVDEWRDEPARHRYVHGGFEGTDTKFSVYFPPPEQYEGRFFHPVLPMSGIEFAATIGVLYGVAGSIEFAIDSGAYLVESNMGTTSAFPGHDATLTGYRASAAVARYSRQLAAEMYGEHRPYGYVYGGSGGGLKTASCIESTNDVWDGAVPFVIGTPMSMPNVFSAQAHAFRLLWDRFGDIVDAIEPGGSGDMYAGLTAEQREALAEITRFGFPPRAWFDVERIARGYTGVWSVLADSLLHWDPSYFEDFWTVPGYLGVDAPESLASVRIQHKTTVASPVFGPEAKELGLPMPMAMPRGTTAAEIPVGLRLADLPEGNLLGATVTLTGGAAAGALLTVTGVADDVVLTGVSSAHVDAAGGIAAGDEVLVDNSIYLAFQTYHRHQVHPQFSAWDQFVADGKPIYPQREMITGPRYARQGSGSVQNGRITCKAILVQTLMDEAAFPWQGAWYRDRVEEALGDEYDDQFRIWFVDHAMHTGADPMPGMVMADTTPARKTRMVSYLGVLQQALRDVVAWVEHGVAPPPSTAYELVDNQVRVPATAAARGGVQAVVDLTVAGGRDRAEVAVGEPVDFSAYVEVPPGGGTIVSAEWDFDGTAEYPLTDATVDGSSDRLRLSASHTFDAPGTYFPALRITNQRQGDRDTCHARIQNLGRVRVVVRQA